jgi:hypothetical protein
VLWLDVFVPSNQGRQAEPPEPLLAALPEDGWQTKWWLVRFPPAFQTCLMEIASNFRAPLLAAGRKRTKKNKEASRKHGNSRPITLRASNGKRRSQKRC